MLDFTIIAMDAWTSAALCVTTSERLSYTDLWLPTTYCPASCGAAAQNPADSLFGSDL